MLAAVLGHLPRRDKGKAAQVCHLWRELLNDPKLWRKSHVAVDLDTVTPECLLSLKKRQVPLVTITAYSDVKKLQEFLDNMPRLEYLDLSKLRKLSHTIHQQLFPRKMSTMKRLLLPCSGTESIKVIATKMQNLEIFSSKRCECSSPDQNQVSFEALSSSPMQSLRFFQIRSVPLKDGDIVHIREGLPSVRQLWLQLSPEVSETGLGILADIASLEELTLFGLSPSGNISIRPLFSGMAKIRRFHAGFYLSESNASCLATMHDLETLTLCGVNDAVLECLNKGLPKLRDLTLCSVSRVTASGMTNLAKMVQIENLRFFHCEANDENLQIVGKGLVKLKTLNIVNCPQITDEGLKHVGDMPSLHTLGLFNCKIGDAGLLYLSEGVAPLACLKVGQCSGVTQLGREAMMDKRGVSIEEHRGHIILVL